MKAPLIVIAVVVVAANSFMIGSAGPGFGRKKQGGSKFKSLTYTLFILDDDSAAATTIAKHNQFVSSELSVLTEKGWQIKTVDSQVVSKNRATIIFYNYTLDLAGQ